MRYLSLFSGIGGFELGIQQAYENLAHEQVGESDDKRHSSGTSGRSKPQLPSCIGYSEIDKYANQIYRKHFPEHKAYGDITKINPKE